MALAGALATAQPSLAQVQQEEPDAMDVARTPLTDLNIVGEDIPEVLVSAAQGPYVSEGLVTCNDIVVQIAAIDQALGPDYDLVGESDTGLSEGKIAQGLVGSLIPFRGIVREVSGAAGDERKLRAAATAGMVRRGYLKGLGQERGCQYPARPKPAPPSE
ncbi:hypothetical protein KDC96_03920 [Erythrobacter sp. JK5]|nr:hypothetical protein KDC96_03920 [Erythrobacter sp. JK5]